MVQVPNNRQGQAALEFIMTYGWAILVIMVMIGALAYLGVMNPSKFTGDKCMISTGFNCKDYKIVQKTETRFPTLYLSIENKIGDTITITSTSATFNNPGGACILTCTTPSTIGPDKSAEITCAFPSRCPTAIGEQMKIEMNIKYTTTRGSGYTHAIDGEITTTMQ